MDNNNSKNKIFDNTTIHALTTDIPNYLKKILNNLKKKDN
jgi:hypothetical protein